jgi:hypothetical protein
MPPSKGMTVGFLCPSLASKLTDLMVAAPTPLSATRFSRDLDVPRNPDGRIVGFDMFIPHRSVLRFGIVILLDRIYRMSKKSEKSHVINVTEV